MSTRITSWFQILSRHFLTSELSLDKLEGNIQESNHLISTTRINLWYPSETVRGVWTQKIRLFYPKPIVNQTESYTTLEYKKLLKS